MEVLVDHLGDVQFEVHARQHTVVCDQPVENGGYDEGMTPPELMLASLGTCAGFYAAMYMKKHKLTQPGMRVRVSAEKAKQPARLDNFKIEIEVPLDFPKDHEKGVLDSVHHCLIHNTLLHSPKIETSVKYPQVKQAA
jgi:putative redox protein